jgi:hypothetical protein
VSAGPVRSAERLLRCYPPGWRARYGAEFAALLEADIAERPRCWRRTADVLAAAAGARARSAGVAGPGRGVDERARLGAVLAAATAFLLVGLTVWGQLAVAGRWAPAGRREVVALVVMSAAGAVVALLAAAATLPVALAAGRALLRPGSRLRAPGGCLAVAVSVLAVGCHHFAAHWPGTGGHPWEGIGSVPSGVAACVWALTVGVSSYWAHPAALGAFPRLETIWMAASLVALAAATAAAVTVLRRVELSRRVLEHVQRMAGGAARTMVLFLSGAACWVLGPGSPATAGLRPGIIDVAGLGVMAACAGVAGVSSRTTSA